jgi:tetratricopeptide (TPR) repeat protein
MKENCCGQQIRNRMRRGSVAIVAVTWLGLYGCVPALADSRKQENTAETFFNPLEITTPDPLLPQTKRPLTTLEQLKLRAALDELNRRAAARLAAGDDTGAFAIWNRELRLRRALGFQEEVAALGRVGEIAWRENQGLEVQVITRRLQAIQQQVQSQPTVNLRLLRSLGLAFEQVREPRSAIAVYEQILGIARQRKDIATEEATLRTLAQLRLSWFDYQNAAATYRQLLKFATARGDRFGEINYLQQLNFVYEQARQYQQAIAVKQQLGEIYQNQQQVDLLPGLQIAIARNYQALGQLEEAFQNYQQAYTSAWTLQQYDDASDALGRLIALYRSQEQIDAALQTSQILLQAQQLASNTYGMMVTYDGIGQIHLQRGEYPEALAAFQNGLQLAQQLQYQESYFAGRVKQVNRQLPK